jgi:hypothetical protein
MFATFGKNRAIQYFYWVIAIKSLFSGYSSGAHIIKGSLEIIEQWQLC